jgi:hypothetical protein
MDFLKLRGETGIIELYIGQKLRSHVNGKNASSGSLGTNAVRVSVYEMYDYRTASILGVSNFKSSLKQCILILFALHSYHG